MKRGLLILFHLTFLSLATTAQGFFFSKYYSPKDYKGETQNWDIEQDTNQFIHFGNGSGVIRFNGVDWSSLHIGESGRGTSLFNSESGKFYASGQYDYGYILADSLNKIAYSSISSDYYGASDPFNEHFSTFEIDSVIFFYGWKGLEVLAKNEIVKYPFDNVHPPTAFKYKDKVFVSNSKGIYNFDNGEYEYFKKSNVLDKDTIGTSFALPTNDERILLGHIVSGLYYFDGINFEKFDTILEDSLKDGYLYNGVQINDSVFAIGTLYKGLFLLNKNGKKEGLYNENSGLENNGVLDLFIDHEKTLWMGLNDGIQKLSINVPINVYSEFDGVNHTVLDLQIMDDIVWTESFGNIKKSILLENERVLQFRPADFKGSLIQWRNKLYLFNEKGVFELEGDTIGDRIIEGHYSIKIQDHDSPQELILASSAQALFYNGIEEKYLSFSTDIKFEEGIKKDSVIYLLSSENGVYRIEENGVQKIPFKRDQNIRVLFNKIGVINDEVYVATEGAEENGGLYKLNKDSLVFEKSDFFGALDRELISHQVLEFEHCENGDVWFQNNKMIKRATKVNGEWEVQRSPYQMIGDYDAIYKIHCEGDDVWFGGVNGLYQLTNPDWDYKTDFKTNITGIYVNNDSLIYGGFGEPVKDIVLPYEDNELRFTYAAASYIDPERNTYSYKLEGFDRDWSEWSLETQKDYTNIPEGNYIFKIRSKNVYEVDGREDQISFSVLPPWYRTWWAYVLYLMLVTAVFYSIYKVRINQLLKVERMRTKIASDLHDEVSATLTGISYFAEAVRRDKNKAKKEHFISLITESAGDAKEKITDIVWSINPDNDDWGMFLSKCRRYASDLLESKDIKYDLKIADKIPGKLPMEVRQHLWMIYKEMLTNAVRHSNASRLDVIMDVDGRYLKLIVQDDGQGFDSEDQRAGNGVSNIKRRAEAINATLEIDSESGFGTRWRLVLPL